MVIKNPTTPCRCCHTTLWDINQKISDITMYGSYIFKVWWIVSECWVVGCWHGCLEWGADLHMAQQMPLPHASVKSRLLLPFWYRLTRVVLKKGPLNGCVCVCGGIANNQNKKVYCQVCQWKKILISEYLIKLQARRWLFRALCVPGHHTAMDMQMKVHDIVHLFARKCAKY